MSNSFKERYAMTLTLFIILTATNEYFVKIMDQGKRDDP